jgi:hypothetical protein
VLSPFEADEDPTTLAAEAARCATTIIVEGMAPALERWP